MPQYSPHRAPLSVFWVIVIALFILISATIVFAPAWTCAPFRLADLSSSGELPPPMPPGCVPMAEAVPDEMLQALENKRQQMGVELKETVSCVVPAAQAKRLDPQWLQKMYEGGTLRYRRHVLLAATQDSPKGLLFVVERCMTPWWKFVEESGTSCWAQFNF
ncbi:MAG TPA: hypothetical protein VF753_04360 [Terriglobales bacterium]